MISTDHAVIGETFIIYVDTIEDDVTDIVLHTVSPSGIVDSCQYGNEGKYQIDTETGIWTIYASVTNSAGTYTAQKPEDYATIEIISIRDAFGNIVGS